MYKGLYKVLWLFRRWSYPAKNACFLACGILLLFHSCISHINTLPFPVFSPLFSTLFSFPRVTVISPDFSSELHALVYGCLLIISSQLFQGILKNEFLVSEWHLHPSVYTCHKPRCHSRPLPCTHSPIHSIIGLFLFHFVNISGIY